ncbi:hypothetical protein QJS66_17055 [Kocuria rhizophila]|nr:hypothetical protein QJS66_17055 [Kocuria rhizophila]
MHRQVVVKEPRQWTTTVVNAEVCVGANAKVTTRAKYKTTTNTKQAKASARGTAAGEVPDRRATPGRTVWWTCHRRLPARPRGSAPPR